MLTRRTFLVTTAALALVLHAADARADVAGDAGQWISKVADEAIQNASAKDLGWSDKLDRFRHLFVAVFDLPEIGRFVLGRYWRSATPDQQKDFLDLFEQISVLTWARRFTDYGGVKIDIQHAAPDGERGFVVESSIQTSKGQPIAVTWRLRQPDGGFKIVDIVVEGVSMAITHRSEYSSALQSSGGLPGLLDLMRKKVEQLKAQPPA